MMWLSGSNGSKKRLLDDGKEDANHQKWILQKLMQMALQNLVDHEAPWDLLFHHCQEYVCRDSYVYLAFLYEHGLGVSGEPNSVKAAEYRLQAANTGHGPSALRMAQNASSDIERVLWYKIASANGEIEARYQLGKCYLNGRGVAKDLNEALTYFVLCEDKHAKALRRRGHAFEWEEKYKEAFVLYEQAAKLGDYHSYYEMAMLLQSNSFETTTLQRSLQFVYLQLAAEHDVKDANNHLGANYLCGKQYNGFNYCQDYELAVFWYERAAKLGVVRAKYRLGTCYENGWFYTKDLAKAFTFYQEAAKENDMLALVKLAQLYYNGCTGAFEEDHKQAFHYAELATQHQDANGAAWTNLGTYYMNGTGTEINRSKALECWELAVTKFDDMPAKKALKDYYDAKVKQYT